MGRPWDGTSNLMVTTLSEICCRSPIKETSAGGRNTFLMLSHRLLRRRLAAIVSRQPVNPEIRSLDLTQLSIDTTITAIRLGCHIYRPYGGMHAIGFNLRRGSS